MGESFVEELDLSSIAAKIDQFLDSIQLGFLQEEKKIGLWLTGIQFSTLDCLVTGILLRLYQLGWDEHLWSQGEKADISMYANQHFKDQVLVKLPRYACYAALGLASVYIVKKVFFKK